MEMLQRPTLKSLRRALSSRDYEDWVHWLNWKAKEHDRQVQAAKAQANMGRQR